MFLLNRKLQNAHPHHSHLQPLSQNQKAIHTNIRTACQHWNRVLFMAIRHLWPLQPCTIRLPKGTPAPDAWHLMRRRRQPAATSQLTGTTPRHVYLSILHSQQSTADPHDPGEGQPFPHPTIVAASGVGCRGPIDPRVAWSLSNTWPTAVTATKAGTCGPQDPRAAPRRPSRHCHYQNDNISPHTLSSSCSLLPPLLDTQQL
jgi:hypothetical protein